MAQINKVANLFWEADPIAQMKYEYDKAVEQLKEGRVGLEQYRGLVERVTRQVSANKSHVQKLEAETKAYLKAGDLTTAAKFALELQKAKGELATNEGQLSMHETAYGNSLKKIQHANEKLIELREKITKYDAELKMSAAEAEIAKLSESFDMNLTTDFGEIEQVIQQKIDQNRGKVRVAADLSEKGIAEIKAEERMQGELAEQALQGFEVELGLRSPETTPVAQTAKDLGPAAERTAERTVRFAINVWAGWGPIIYANNGFKPGKVWKSPSGKDFKLELVLIDDPIGMRDAYAGGKLHIGWATLDMLPLFLEGLRKDSRVMPRVYQQVDWSNGGDGIVVRESVKTMSDLRGKTIVLAQNSPSHFFVLNALINAGVQPAEVEFKFTQDAFQAAAAFNADKRLAGVVSWAPDIYNLEKVK